MNNVWVLSEGETGRVGENMIAVYGTYETAIAELRQLALMAGGSDISESWASASFSDGMFYTIIRQRNVL